MKANKDFGRLVMTLKIGDVVILGEDTAITFKEYGKGRVKILINAPKSLNIGRVDAERNQVQRKSYKSSQID